MKEQPSGYSTAGRCSADLDCHATQYVTINRVCDSSKQSFYWTARKPINKANKRVCDSSLSLVSDWAAMLPMHRHILHKC